MANIYIGPAGWSYKDWVGPFYPEGKRLDKLLYVARYFNCAEINSTFYRLPSEALVRSWAERVGIKKDFRFSIKVLKKFSHERISEQGELEEFIHRFDPLTESDLLGSFLVQFPWSFKNESDSRKYIEKLAKSFHSLPLAVELRHGSWNSPDTQKLFRDNEIAFCNIDQPLIGNSMPPTNFVSSTRLAYIRLHGRNFANWFKENAGRDERYNYLYSMNEMNEWAERASQIAEQVDSLFIITNNHFRGQALANAFQMKFLINGEKLEIPPEMRRSYPQLKEISKSVERSDLELD
ncbi:MAG: hypothetical protein B6D63_02685 [Candidatus Latescibacteria bacterium 4484_7]|nr:MAG: hypothetical protein B6D63_02685 [Candidatus Latescibacteria bacterium 4484_7]